MPKKDSKHVGKVTVKGTKTRFKTRKGWYKKPRAKKVKPPKPVAPIKPSRPKRSNLKKIYRNLITTDRDQRVNTLREAMSWYDTCLAYVYYKQEGKPTLTQLRHQDAAERARTQGINTVKSQSKETHFLKAIESFEKVVNGFKPPRVKVVLDKFEKDRAKLEARRKRMRDRFGEFLEEVKRSLQPRNPEGKRIELRVDKISSPYRIDDEGNVTFDRKVIAHLRKMARKHGLLPVVMQMISPLREAAARTPEIDPHGHKTGRMVINKRKALIANDQMMNSLIQYEMLAEKPRKLVRRIRKKPGPTI